MFHLFHGFVTDHGDISYLDNGLFGVQVTYAGSQHEGTYFLYPLIDQTRNTVKYYAFDSFEQKQFFLLVCKIQGVGSKSAYSLAFESLDDVQKAIDEVDLGFFKSLPGIGPKTAKRLVVELKDQIKKKDVQFMQSNEKLVSDIVATLHNLGYERTAIKNLLPTCPHQLEEKNLQKILKRLISEL